MNREIKIIEGNRLIAKSLISKDAKGCHIELYQVTTLYLFYIPIYKKYSVIKSQL